MEYLIYGEDRPKLITLYNVTDVLVEVRGEWGEEEETMRLLRTCNTTSLLISNEETSLRSL